MPNKKGGKGFKKGGKKFDSETKFIPTKAMNQEYGRVTTMLGNSRLNVYCDDEVTRMAKMQKSLKKEKMFIALGDLVLLNLQEYQDAKAYVAYRYTPQEAKKLLKMGEINPKTLNPDMEEVDDDIFDRDDDAHANDDNNDGIKVEDVPEKKSETFDDIWDSL